MGSVERVRVKPASRVARSWEIAPETEGIVICRYRPALSGSAAPDRLDVRFSQKFVLWGVPASEFEPAGKLAFVPRAD